VLSLEASNHVLNTLLYIAMTLTTGGLHLIITYVVGGMVVLFLLMALIGMLAIRRGREAISEGCLEAIFDGFLGKG
jgi:hypothetical protein